MYMLTVFNYTQHRLNECKCEIKINGISNVGFLSFVYEIYQNLTQILENYLHYFSIYPAQLKIFSLLFY